MLPPVRRERVAAAIALAAPILLLCSPWLFTPDCLHAIDFEVGYRPFMAIAREEFAARGEFPRWNPRQYAGTPFLGSFQVNLYYPPNALFLLLPAEEAHDLFVALHLLLAAFGMYRLSRGLRLGRPAGVLSGLAYALSFAVIGRLHAGHLPYFTTLCQAPLFLALLLGAMRKPTAFRGLALGLAAFAVLTAGNPQTIYHLLLVSAGAVAWRLVELRRRREPPWKPAGLAAASLLWGAALAAVHLLPALELASWTSRRPGEGHYGKFELLDWHALRVDDFLTLLAPSFPCRPEMQRWLKAEYWHEKSLYFGVLPLFCAGLAWLDGKRRGAAVFFSSAAAWALLDAMAVDLPVHDLMSRLPGYASFRVPARATWIAVLGLCVLAGQGWQAAAERPWAGTRGRVFLALCASAVGLSMLLYAVSGAAIESLLFAAAAAVGLFLLHRAPRREAWVVPATLGLVALNLVALGMETLRTVDRAVYRAEPWYADLAGADRGAFRVLNFGSIDSGPTVHGFRLLRGNGYPQLRSTLELYASAWKNPVFIAESLPGGYVLVDSEPLRKLNVRWVVAPFVLPGVPWTLRATGPDGSAWYELPEPGPPAELDGAAGKIELRRPDGDTILASVVAEGPGRVRLSEAWMPGWTATLGGRPLELRSVAGLIGFDVPAGASVAALRYRPRAWRIGWIVTLMTAAAAGAFLGGRALVRKLRRTPSSPGP